MGGETDQWTPYLFQNTTQVFPWIGKSNYNLTTDLADEAIAHMRQLNAAAPDQPFFVYYVPGGTHSPHQPTKEWIDKISGMHLFDKGWNSLREDIFANQKRLGVIPPNTQLTAWPDDLPKWETLSADEKKLFARQADVFAAYVAYTDNEIGRVIQEVQDEGKLDNTLIIYISGDNGTSAEGTTVGTPNQYTAYNGILDLPIAEQLKAYDAWGSAATYPHMPVATATSLQADHAQLEPTLDRLREIADALDHADGPGAVALISDADRIVTDRIVAHEQDDENRIYPRVAKYLADLHGLGAMSRAHREIIHLSRLLRRLAEGLRPEDIDPYLIRDAQRVVESIEALVRIHNAQEEDIYEYAIGA